MDRKLVEFYNDNIWHIVLKHLQNIKYQYPTLEYWHGTHKAHNLVSLISQPFMAIM